MKDRLGLSHWVPSYPLDAMRRSAQERQVYAVWLDTCVVATFTIGTQPPPYYHTIPGVMGNLGTHPFGWQCMLIVLRCCHRFKGKALESGVCT